MGQTKNAGGKQKITYKIKEKLHQDNQRLGKFCQEERYEIPTTFDSSKIGIRTKTEVKAQKIGRKKER